MTVGMSKPSAVNAEVISVEFTKRLKRSLFHLYEIAELNHGADKKSFILDSIKKISGKESFLWLICAINRRLIELYERDCLGAFYWAKLIEVITDKSSKDVLIEPGQFSRFECHLFLRYSFETGSYPITHVDTLTPSQKSLAQTVVNEAMSLAEIHVPDIYGEIKNYVTNILVFNSDKIISGSTFSLAKCIYFRAPVDSSMNSVLEVLDLITHEVAHMHLHLLSIKDPLVLNDPEELFLSPFRKDNRPMIGIFHAHFVLYRLLILLTTPSLYENFKCIRSHYEKRIQTYLERIEFSKEIVQKHAKLTDLGKSMFDETLSYIKDLQNVPTRTYKEVVQR